MKPFVDIHTHHKIDRNIIAIRNIDVDNLTDIDVSSFYSIGIHPWKLGIQEFWTSGLQGNQNLLEFLGSRISGIQKSRDPNFLALGECGLDRACCHDFEAQKRLFIKHIELSEQYVKPLIIHCVRSYPDIISIRKETKAKQTWIIHGFQGNEQTTEQLLRHEEIYLSIGEVLFKNEDKARRLFEIIPSDRLFFETDDSEREISDVYEKAALLSGKDVAVFCRDIFNNFEKNFGKI
ncbi:MAG: TatD family hydrolase [Bacteroidales bacterium]|nr:TatD family hydrolase [Bacteroidales bacterium]